MDKPYPAQNGPPGQPYAHPQQPGYPQTQYQYYAPPPPYPSANPAGATVFVTPPQQTCVVTHCGNCPHCGVGNLVPTYNPCGIVLAILFFPIGILCCLAMVDNQCTHCGYCT